MLFGGTFDPVHLGHLHAADVVCRRLGLATLRMVLSARPSHKSRTGASLEDRWAMLQLACAEDPRLIADDIELRRGGPSYTVETLEAVRAENPGARLAWVVGSDAYALLPTWHRWQDVLKLASLVVLKRPGPFPTLSPQMQALTRAHHVDRLDGIAAGGVLIVDDAMKEISSADIRAAIAAGRDVRNLLPDAVATYIEQHGLYRHS